MLEQPRFSPVYDVRIRDDGVLLVEDDRYALLSGPVCLALAPHLDGRTPVADIVARVADSVGAAEAYFVLMEMEERGYLVEGGGTEETSSALWARFGVEAAVARRRLGRYTVSLHGPGGLDMEPLAETLCAQGVGVEEEGDLTVVLAADLLDPELDAFNRDALARERPFLLVQLAGTTVWLGPLVVPHETACWSCLAHRLRANRPAHVFLRETENGTEAPTHRSVPPSVARVAEGMIGTEVLRWIVAPEDHLLAGTLVQYDAVALETTRHAVTRRPQCPACGDPDRFGEAQPIELDGRPRIVVLDGGYRTATPDETLARFEPLVSPLTGIVRTIRPVEVAGTDLLHNVTVGHSMHLRGITLGSLRHNTRDHSGGKGRTAAQARASGLCEALERYSGVFQGDEPTRLARFTDFGDDALHPNRCMGFSEAQYRERDAWNASRNGTFQDVPEPFDPDTEIAWTPVWSLTHHAFRYLPTAYCYFGVDGPGRRFCPGDSNGLAGGNCLEEAILQGFFELVERDAVAIWWYNRTRLPGVDFDSFGDPYIVALRTYYRSISRELWALDVTTDLGIPAFTAVSRRVDGDREDIIMGFGAHTSARIALVRALTEVNQGLPTVLRSPEERQRLLQPDFQDALDWWDTATLDNQPYLVPATDRPTSSAKTYPEEASANLKEEVERCVEIAGRQGLEVLALDLTRPDIGLAVAKVFVPGLRHFWKRLGPGRLYDVPVALGWLDRPTEEAALNPVPMFL